jgi:uncharacterized protein (TIGR00730 family)
LTFRVCVFCGARSGHRLEYALAARQLGGLLARRGIGLVFGGGRIGLMGVLADSALEGGGEAIGVIPEALVAMEQAHAGLTRLHVVRDMHERKALMHDSAQAFLALPGGIGTFEEFCEALTWSAIGYHSKPCGLLDVDGYFEPFLAMLDHAVTEGFLDPAVRGSIVVDRDAGRLLDRLARVVAAESPQSLEK